MRWRSSVRLRTANAIDHSWITQLSMEPVLIGIGVDNAKPHRLISGWLVHGESLGQRRDPTLREVLKPAVDDGASTVDGTQRCDRRPIFEDRHRVDGV